jgi:hypothetical protein
MNDAAKMRKITVILVGKALFLQIITLFRLFFPNFAAKL